MRQTPNLKVEPYRLLEYSNSSYGNNGAFQFQGPKNQGLRVIVSDGEGWEHVSVSCTNRCPNWPEMCFIKDLFWGEEETVIQYHPPKSEYVNCHPNCLHMWKPIGIDIFTPPSEFVGPKEATP